MIMTHTHFAVEEFKVNHFISTCQVVSTCLVHNILFGTLRLVEAEPNCSRMDELFGQLHEPINTAVLCKRHMHGFHVSTELRAPPTNVFCTLY